MGLLKAKLARYRAQLLEPTTKSSGGGSGFDVQKSGDARVALIGFPSVGKSTLLSKCTHTQSESAAYEFTTLTVCSVFLIDRARNIIILHRLSLELLTIRERGYNSSISQESSKELVKVVVEDVKLSPQRKQQTSS